MAVFHHHRAERRAEIGGASATGQELPTGCCNFRDLRPGASLTSCGCKRFWLNVNHFGGQQGTERAWCFCGHHACFHDAFSQQRQQESSPTTVPVGGGDEDSQAVHEFHAAPPGYVPAHQIAHASSKRPTGLGIQSGSQSQSQSINTRIWEALNGFARQQAEGDYSDVPSTAAPSVTDERRSSPSYRLAQHEVKTDHTMGPPVNIPANMTSRPSVDEYSATEVNTPSMTGTPDFVALAGPSYQAPASSINKELGGETAVGRQDAQTTHSESASNTPRESTEQQPMHAAVPGSSVWEMQNLIRSYGRRLDLLESLSFSHVAVEDLQEEFEHFDGRLLELEQWRTEHERERASPEPRRPFGSKRRRLLATEMSSFASDVSFDDDAAARTEAIVMATLATNAITDPRIEALENRVVDLENVALPSYLRPWQVQVVLLPWGRQLRGIWFSSTEATQRSMKSSTQEEWSGAQSMPKLSFRTSETGAWTTESIQAWANEAQDWLSPKACGPSGTVFQRLTSRGLVQNITLTAPDARHISGALKTAFGDLLVSSDRTSDPSNPHQALYEDFVPLRKVRKSSRLRLLTPSEMVTAASWDAAFMDASVFMKLGDGQRRLYLTTPLAYLQPNKEGWTWSRLRDLPIFGASAGEQAVQVSGAAIEACWSYNENIDYAPSTHSSFASNTSPWTADTPELRADEQSEALNAPSLTGAHVRHHRTVSLPSSSLSGMRSRDDLPRRRVASFETAGVVPIHADECGLEIQAKRRRISHSPELERNGVNFTPRWSREPPSPFTSEIAAEAQSQAASSRNKRGATPSAYATPHSNNQYVGRQEYFGEDGDTEADTELGAGGSEHGEEEWEGVDDGSVMRQESDDTAHIEAEDDIGEDSLGEGFTNFEP